jgi:hypothetical protein
VVPIPIVAIPAETVTSIGLLHEYSVLGILLSEYSFTSISVKAPEASAQVAPTPVPPEVNT